MATVSASALGRPLVRARAIIDYTELVAAGTSETVDLMRIPASAVVQDVFIEVPALLADAGSISAVTLKIGDGSDDDRFLTALGVFTGDTQTRQAAAGAGPLVMASAATMVGTLTATGANFGDGSATALDAGQIVVTVTYRLV
ncbi:hypothetical protein K0U83_22275 [bacterium]|nr:hypothetical protein [bacterium]